MADHNGNTAIDQPNQVTFDCLVYATVSVDLKVLTLMDGWHLQGVLLSGLESEQCSREMCKQGLARTDNFLRAPKFGRGGSIFASIFF